MLSLSTDYDADAAGFDTAELQRERRLGEFKFDALADALQPVAPVAAMDLSRLSPWTTSIQPSDDKVILYVLLYAGAGASINPANVVFDFGARSGPTDRKLHLTKRL